MEENNNEKLLNTINGVYIDKDMTPGTNDIPILTNEEADLKEPEVLDISEGGL